MAKLLISRVLENNTYKVTFESKDISNTEQAIAADFGEPTVIFGGTIDVTSLTKPLTVVSTVGFIEGEVVEGQTSGAVGTIFLKNGAILYLITITGTFVAAELVEGLTSLTSTTLSSIGADITKFQAEFSVVPESTVNFSVSQFSRKLITGLPLTYNLNGDTNSEAEDNAYDLITVTKFDVDAAWDAFVTQADNFTGSELFAL